MDPGPWYATYSSNRSTVGGASSAFSTDSLDQTLLLSSSPVVATSAGGSSGDNSGGSSIIVSSSSGGAPQIVLQTTHTTATLGSGQTSPFSPTSFLQASGATPVSYDVFSPFSFNSPKQATSYVSSQSVVGGGGGTQGGVSSSQPGSPEEASFASSQNNDSYYRTSTSSPTAAWSLTNPKTQTTQDNPFGILPHESVAVASPPDPPQATKQPSGGSYGVYSPQNGNGGGTVAATEAAKTGAWSSSAKQSRTSTESPIDDNAFYNHHQGASYDSASAYSPVDDASSATHHQSCIVTTPNVTSTNGLSQLSSSPVPTTIYLTAATTTQNQQTVVANNHDEGHDSNQSSPVSYSIMSYASPTQSSSGGGKANNGNNSAATATVQFHVLGQAQQQQQQQQNSCRLYSSEQEYHHPVRSKSAASTDSAYSSSTSQNGPDCGAPGVVPRRPSPMQSHSQASPLGHVPSPATYPMYNSPMTSMSSPSPLQSSQQANVVQMTPPSPMDAVTRSPQQNQVVYSSVITRALGTQNESGKAYNTTDGSNASGYERTQDYVQTTKQLCPWDGDIQQQHQQTTTTYLTSDNSDTTVLTTQQMHGLLDDHHHQQQQHHHHLETTTINLQDLSTDDDPRELNGRRCAKIAPKRAPMTSGLESELANSVSYQLEALTASGQVVLNAQTNQQNGGGYIELERWNLTPLQNGAKIIATAPAAPTYVATQQQQQQSAAAAAAAQVVQAASLVTANPTLLVAHPPTISYYPTFHIAQATPHITHLQPQQQQQTTVVSDLQHTIEISTLDLQNDCQQHLPQQQQQQQQPQQQLITIQQQDINSYNPDVVREDRPQVIVPDIEEELGFLKQVNSTSTPRQSQQQQHLHHQHNNNHHHNQSRHNQHLQQQHHHHHNNHNQQYQQPKLNHDLKRSANNEPNSGFMTSFLKFLQGEKDSSPPPLARGGRKTGSWPKAVKPYNSASNSADAWSNNRNNNSSNTTNDSKDKPVIDYANDPRYFPLPKERQRFDSSDDGFSSSENELGGGSATFGRKAKSKENSRQNGGGADSAASVGLPYGLGPALPIKPPEGRPKKGRPIKPGGPTDRKRKAAAAAAAAAAEAAAKGLPYPPIPESKKKKLQQQQLQQSMPRRESSRRKAKEKPKLALDSESQSQGDPYEMDDELGDSDSDPAWTPVNKSNVDEDDNKHRRKRGRPPVIYKRQYNKQQRHSDFLGGATNNSPGLSPALQHHQPKKPGRKRKNHLEAQRVANSRSSGGLGGEDNSYSSRSSPLADDEIDITPFKTSASGESLATSGEFVVIKTDLDQEYPPLWRIDGKTLLQKYEPFQANGKTLYRNISTYSGWAPQSRYIYQSVPVKFWQQNKDETIVEFLRDQMTVDEGEAITRFMKDTEKYQDNFEVYIQTLISQALDSNFLTEIFQEQDEYFLLNVKKVDEITEERKQRLLSTTKWQSNVITALSTWPCINLLKDNIADRNKTCSGCGRVKLFSRILLYGQPYNSTTLEGCPPDPQVPQEKDFLFCRVCQTKVNLFNKVAHQKYLMFLECARMVAQKRAGDVHKDTTIILNELLADEAWLNQLFRDVRAIWAEIDSLHEKVRKKAEKLAAAAAAESENKQQEQQSQVQEQQQQQLHQQSNLQDNFNNEVAQQQLQQLQQQQELQMQQQQIRQNQLQRQQLNLQQRLMNGLSYS